MMEAFEIWKVRTDEKRDLLKHYQALQHYRMSLLLRTMKWMRGRLRIRQGLGVLFSAHQGQKYHAFHCLIEFSLKQQLLTSSWHQHRATRLARNVLIRWRELTLKNKLATLFFKRKVFMGLATYVQRKNRLIPAKFYARYR